MLNGLVGLRRAELSAAESVVHDLVLRKKDNDSVTAGREQEVRQKMPSNQYVR